MGFSGHVNNDNLNKTTPMTTTTFTIRNTEKAARTESRSTGKISVRFPFSDYYRGKGRVFTGRPVEARKPIIRDGRVFVKYDCREFEVFAQANVIIRGLKADIVWSTI